MQRLFDPKCKKSALQSTKYCVYRYINPSIYDISAQNNRRRPKFAQKNEPTWLYSALIKKNSCAKLIVLRLMVTRYIGNMIVFLRCHYAHLSITITSKRSITIKYCVTVIAMLRSPAVSICSLFFFVSCENKLSHYKRSRDLRCITPGIVQCRLSENATLLAIKQLHKITFY